jgi:DNA invertase Pin-like site-specific DNA recombinase
LNPGLRTAIYARISTDRQNPLSNDDQIRKCSEFAERQSWIVLERHTYRDEAVSGTTENRPGLQALLAALKTRPCPFDVLLVDDTSRLSRKTKDALGIFEQLSFAGVRLIAVRQGIDSQNEQADLLVQVHGIVDSLYVKELATKTRRGMEGALLRGMHAGGRCFGYRNVPIEDPARNDEHGRPMILGVRLAINEDEPENRESHPRNHSTPKHSTVIKWRFAPSGGFRAKGYARQFFLASLLEHFFPSCDPLGRPAFLREMPQQIPSAPFDFAG